MSRSRVLPLPACLLAAAVAQALSVAPAVAQTKAGDDQATGSFSGNRVSGTVSTGSEFNSQATGSSGSCFGTASFTARLVR